MVVLKARQASIKYLASAATIDTSGPIDADFSGGTAVTEAKNVTVSCPEGAVEQIPLIGESSNFQNAMMDEKNYTNAKIAGTLVFDGDEILESMFVGTGTTVTTGYTRYQFGSSASGKTRVIIGGMLINIVNSTTEEISIVLNNLYITKLGDIKLTGTDGHFEQDFEGECLPKDFYLEFLD